VDVDTLSSLTVQSGPPWATEVTWSPDGTRLAFSAEDNDSSNRRAMDIHVYVAASDGTAVRRVSHPRWRLGWHFGAQWHPNGSLLMFTGQYPRWDMDFTPFKEYEHPNVFVAELPGLKVRKVSRSTRVSDDFANWCSRPRSTP